MFCYATGMFLKILIRFYKTKRWLKTKYYTKRLITYWLQMQYFQPTD